MGKTPEEKLRETITIVYPELKRIALSKLKRERRNHTLEADALANEALLRILRREKEVKTRNNWYWKR